MHLYDTCMLCANISSYYIYLLLYWSTCVAKGYCMQRTDQLHCSYTVNCLQKIAISLPLHLCDQIETLSIEINTARNDNANNCMYSPKSNESSEIGSKVVFRIPGRLLAVVKGKECAVLRIQFRFTCIVYDYEQVRTTSS